MTCNHTRRLSIQTDDNSAGGIELPSHYPKGQIIDAQLLRIEFCLDCGQVLSGQVSVQEYPLA